ncbi:MAG: glycosyltransferase [Phycisphaerales bacterium]
MPDSASNFSLGIVAIGRNEGERFERCILSLKREAQSLTIVYVDSGSTDNSVAFAKSHGVHVVNLDMSRPFTAARARNAGLDKLLEVSPHTEFVQFIDGDCEVIEGWLAAGSAALQQNPQVVAVSGRLRERFPEKSLYNRLADLEWDRPLGETKSCGGVAMMRIEAVRRVGGFDAGLIAGEEPELCARMRAHGGKILNIADDMAWHDMAMTNSSQWFKRARRHGHAIIEVSYFKTAASRGLFKQQLKSALFWAGIVVFGLVMAVVLFSPVITVPLAVMTDMADYSRHGELTQGAEGAVSISLAAYSRLVLWSAKWILGGIFLVSAMWYLQMLRIAWKARKSQGLATWDAIWYGRLIMVSKEYQVRGMIDFLWRRWRKREATIISFKEG